MGYRSGYATTALTYAANNAIGLYDEAVNNPENKRRFEAHQIMMAVELMQNMSFKKIENETYRL